MTDTNDASPVPLTEYNDITPERLASFGFEEPAQACHVLREMAGHNVPDALFNRLLEIVTRHLRSSADPDRTVANMGRWADAAGNRTSAYGLLTASPEVAEGLLTIFAASQFFSNLLIHNPEYLEILTNPHIRDRERGPEQLWDDLARRVAIMQTPNAKRDALRRFKPPEILRIGIRDLLGYAGLTETTQAISEYADASLRMALQICAEEQGVSEPSFAIIAMGKLGGMELNYSSDVDLIYVHGDTLPAAFNPIKLAGAVRDAMARPTDSSFVFRVDLRLRPEGRFGPISRSLESCRAYYESWAEPWEHQAMLKARFVAGDATVGRAFIEMVDRFAFPSRVEESFVEQIRENKRRIEDKVAVAGGASTNVKEGRGGIRDIEFIVQLWQLIAGGRNSSLRTPNTSEALTRLAEAGLLTFEERDVLAESYAFMRDVEHRLQIMDELPVRNIPTFPRELARFGRRLGYPDGESFLAVYRLHTARVHGLLQRLFYDRSPSAETPPTRFIDRIIDTTEAGAPSQAAPDSALLEELRRMGFGDPSAALTIIRRSVIGSEYGEIHPAARHAFIEVADAVIQASSETTDPDTALRGLDSLAVAVPSRFALYRTFSENPSLLPQLARLAAESPPLWQQLVQHQELLDLLADNEAIDTSVFPPAVPPSTPTALSRWLVRARLQTGARDIWGLAATADVMHDITVIAETSLRGALAAALVDEGFDQPFTIIGMGKLGGAEMGYSSDFDVLYVTDAEENLPAAARVAKRVQQMLHSGMTEQGISLEVDARLRPEGRKGSMVLDLASYQRYWRESAALWERQAHIKARFVAGDHTLGKAFVSAARDFVYGSPLSDEQLGEIRHMKRRIETERTHGENDLKLGAGGLADIEWTCQLLQLRHGHTRPSLRRSNTLRALKAIRDDAKLVQSDWEILDAAYRSLTAARNHAYLKAGVAVDSPTPFPDVLRRNMEAARSVCLRVFYGE